MPGTLLVLVLTVHMLDHRGTLKVCLIGVQLNTCTCLCLQWHLVSFPHQLRGGTYGDKYGPLDNMHRVSKGWICVVGTEDCLVLRNRSHWLREGSMLRCHGFWRLGESQTLYKKSVQGNVCVCVCARARAWSEFTSLKHEVQPQQDMDMCIFSFHNQWCMWVEFLSTFECEFLGRVFSKSLSYKVSLFRLFHCVGPTVLKYDLFIDMHVAVIVET